MKRASVIAPTFCLIVGFLLGAIFPRYWLGEKRERLSTAVSGAVAPDLVPAGMKGEPEAQQGRASAPDAQDNVALLEAACAANRALRDRDYAALAGLAHPEKGVTFTPYSSVDRETNMTFLPAQLRSLAQDSTVYAWGFLDGRGSLIEMTASDYIDRYVYNEDYSRAPGVGIDRVLMSGNALENVAEAYPGCRFVDFCFPEGLDSANGGMDWCSLKLVFEQGSGGWLLVGIIHGEWTI